MNDPTYQTEVEKQAEEERQDHTLLILGIGIFLSIAATIHPEKFAWLWPYLEKLKSLSRWIYHSFLK